jgi:WD40 repeat protein
MDRREFLAASAAALACTARLAADEKAAEKAREPDVQLDTKYKGVIAFSPDSKVLAVGHGPVGKASGICFVDTDTGARLEDFEETDVGAIAPPIIAFSRDGQYFAAGADNFVRVWDVRSRRRLRDFPPPIGEKWGLITILEFSADSKYLFACSRLLQLDPGPEGRITAKRFGPIDAVAFCPSKTRFATRNEGKITIWTYPGIQSENTFQPGASGGPIAFTPNGKFVVSRAYETDEYFWEVKSGEPRGIRFQGSPGSYWALSPDGKLFASAGLTRMWIRATENGRIRLSLANRSTLEEGIEELDSINQVKFAPNQKLLACSRAHSGIRIWKDKDGFSA